MLFVSDVIHTQGPLDGSLYAKVRKKDPIKDTANGIPPTAVEHALPAVDHALSVSSDSGNSTASIKTDRTDEVTGVHQTPTVNQSHLPVGEELPLVPTTQQPISPQEKQELEQLLSGLERPMHSHGYLSSPTSAVGGMLHLVPAQVHVNGHNSIDRETDILDDELPSSQVGYSVDSLKTLSSTDGRATPADLYYQSESVINGQDHLPYLERNVPEKPLETGAFQSQVGMSNKAVHLIQSDSGQSSNDMRAQNGNLYRSQSLGADPYSMPQAPARTTSSRNAVQRGLTVWQQFGVPEEPVTDGLTFSPPPPVSMVQSHHSLPQFPHRRSASQQEIEQSIETLNLLMLDLEPGVLVPVSQSAPLRDNIVVTTQPSQIQSRPSYEADAASHTHLSSPVSIGETNHLSSAQMSPRKTHTPELPSIQGLKTSGTSSSSQSLPLVTSHFQLNHINNYPTSLSSQSAEASERQENLSAASASPQPRDCGPEEVFNVEGLVAQRVAGKSSHELLLFSCPGPFVTSEVCYQQCDGYWK